MIIEPTQKIEKAMAILYIIPNRLNGTSIEW